MKVAIIMMKLEDVIAEHMGAEVAFEHIRFLTIIAFGVNQSAEMCNLYGYNRVTVSRSASRLAQKELITITEDGKARKFYLTPKAQEMFVQLDALLKECTTEDGTSTASDMKKTRRKGVMN